MTTTFLALLLAHVLSDFLLQPDAWAGAKHRLRPLLLHGAVVLVLSLAASGSLHPAIFALAAIHVAVDAVKARFEPSLAAFLADQAAHVATVAAVAALVPGLWAGGLWAGLLPPAALGPLADAAIVLTGFVLATRAGGFAVGLLVARWPGELLTDGLPGGGRWIGLLERALILLFLLAGQESGIGFLIAAKSILRFDTASRDQSAAEYVIIGTLASFGWALAVGYLTVWALALGDAAGTP